MKRLGRFGSVDAIIVDTVKRGPRQMAGMGAGLFDTDADQVGAGTSLLDAFTGGQYTIVSDKLDSISLGLKLSIAASVLSGALATIALFAYASGGAPRRSV